MTRSGWALLGILIAVGAALAIALPRFEGTSPTIDAPDSLVLGQEPIELEFIARDLESGLRTFEVRLQSTAGTRTVASQEFPGSFIGGGAPGSDTIRLQLALDVAEHKLPDGAAKLTLTARDWSWRDALAGNRAERSVLLTVDTKPPRVAVESGLTYVYRGGSAAVVYGVEADSERHGVDVAGTFFPGHPLGDGPAGESGAGSARRLQRRIALFAVPVEAPSDPTISVVASDAAGNRSTASFPARVLERRFPEDDIRISHGFLDRVAVPLAEAHDFEASDPVRAFQWVNAELRANNEAQIREVVANSADEALWTASFQQMTNSKVTSRFAELRSYLLDGEKISQARHYGFDLASTAGAPILASNDGVVLFAGPLGIYGNCVIVDHGLGLTTLYAHLSQIDVEPGDRVAQNGALGRSGATGLAGGDHLHFAILVGDTYVDPMEWWDPRWVKSHVRVRLD